MHNISEGGWTGVLEHLQVHFPSNIGVAMMRERISNMFLHVFVMLETSVKVFGLEGIWVQSGLCVFVGVRSSPADDLPGPERWGYRVTPTVQYKGTRTQKHMRFTLTPNSWLIKHTITNRPPFTNEYSHYPDQVLLGSSNLQVQNFNYNLFSTNGTKWKAKYVHWCIII